MHELPLLKDIVILLFASIVTSLVFYRLKIPTIIGFILGGIIIGPYGAGLIHEKELVDVMAEIGIVLLLFTIGIEFSLSEIKAIGIRGLTVALAQVLLTTFVVAGVATLFGIPIIVAFFIGFVITLSSTAIVLKIYMGNGEIEAPHGRLALGTLLTQDMAIVPMVLFVQIFGAGGTPSFIEVSKTLGLAIIAVFGIIAAAYYIFPLLLRNVVKLNSSEVFTMAGMFVCLGTAWLSAHFGLSLALGAFIAGIVISESEYNHQTTASILPFRDIFNCIFFISIGMLIKVEVLFEQWLPVLIMTIAIIVLKSAIITAVTTVLRYPLRIGFVTAMGLAQVGEFSFVLLKIGEGQQLIDQGLYQLFLSSIVFSMILTPLLIKLAPIIAEKVRDLGPKIEETEEMLGGKSASAINHVIIAGYGIAGQHLANVLKKTGIPYVVIDINHENIKMASNDGHDAHYGDASYSEVLKSIGGSVAKVLVLAISDPAVTRRAIKIARAVNPKLHIIVRTQFMGEINALSELGADQVIPEEFETSIEIFSRVLKEYKTPVNIIQNQIDMIRLEGYAMLRGSSLKMEKITELTSFLAASVSETFFVRPGSPADGKTIRELNLRKESGASIIAIASKGQTKSNPSPDYLIEHDDILVLLGSHAEITAAIELLSLPPETT
ncbi:MAG: cation:proton antiporter [Proteobacteria bacterium]|nr:cation:proton antiporter [Pseudomonadota bacterium]